MAWTCPECERRFGRKGQSHVCEPGLTVDERTGAQYEHAGFGKFATDAKNRQVEFLAGCLL